MNISRYLDRLEAAERRTGSLSYLAELQTNHVRKIPFENLDIMRKVPLSMEPDHLERKIVLGGRGGVCYELNGLFHHLLRGLGFDVRLAAATTRGQDGWNLYENTHMLNIVRIDGRLYVADVGFGGNSPGRPVPLDGEEVRDADGFYRTVLEGDVHVLQKREADEWMPLYRFRTDGKRFDDFAQACRFVQSSPESPFNRRIFVTRATDRGRVTLSGNSLTIVEDGEKRKIELREHEIPDALRRWFKLEL
jgi:N-hydroxyarylamine O-acetyltransferase